MSIVKNQQAINSTNNNRFAIFITRANNRYAVQVAPGGYSTFIETNRGWERCDNLANFLVWNADFQGFDDISTLIKE